MSNHRMLDDRELARGVAGLGQESFSVEYPAFNPGIGQVISSRVAVPTVTVGGVRAEVLAHDIRLLIEELEDLRARVAERNDGPSVRVDGGKLVLGRDGVATIKGGTVTITGPVRFAEVRA